ncbi:hypothetical protein BGZ99_001161 [Dissophora globulifera]|uniref:Uncharacterized protein n=1 Tax=Dissophora globulifera TaxID=979702 RepID=A0A9P6RTR5_9FUNG|nr:hypothetical protein BGZ99_001161 [Dissophora globulifera]
MSQRSQLKFGPSRTMAAGSTDMDGVEAEVSQLSVRDRDEDEVMHGGDDDSDDDSAVPGLSEDEGSDCENDDEYDTDNGQAKKSNCQEVLVDSSADMSAAEVSQQPQQQQQQQQVYRSESAASSTMSLQGEPSIISIPEAVYSAVPVSSEVYIIPHSSQGFNWNEDLFMKPNQRATLGVDEMYESSDDHAGNGSSSAGISVHEIRMNEDDSRQILPL